MKIDTDLLQNGYEALCKQRITGRPLYAIDKDGPVRVQCTIDTRGLRGEKAANREIKKARKALEKVFSLPVTVLATGHTFKEPPTAEELILYLQEKYDY